MNQNISTLNLPKSTILQLQSAGFNHTIDIEQALLSEENKLRNIQKAQVQLPKPPKTQTALEIYQEELLLEKQQIKCYIKPLDKVLHMAIVPRAIVELTGASGCGKTQVCLRLCVGAQISHVTNKAVYIYSNYGFCVQQFKEVVRDFFLKNPKEVSDLQINKLLENIYCIQVDDPSELFACIKHLKWFLPDEYIRLVVVDSISYPLRIIEPRDRARMVSAVFKSFRDLAELHNLAVVITNDLTTRIKDKTAYQTPSFGESFSHFVNTRVLLSKKTATVFHAKLLKGIMGNRIENDDRECDFVLF